MYKAIRVTREVDPILILIEDLDQFGTSVQVKISDFQLNDEGLVVQFNEIIRSNKTQLKIWCYLMKKAFDMDEITAHGLNVIQ